MDARFFNTLVIVGAIMAAALLMWILSAVYSGGRVRGMGMKRLRLAQMEWIRSKLEDATGFKQGLDDTEGFVAHLERYGFQHPKTPYEDEFTVTGDSDLNELMNLGADMQKGNANMDTGLLWLKCLDKVLDRLNPHNAPHMDGLTVGDQVSEKRAALEALEAAVEVAKAEFDDSLSSVPVTGPNDTWETLHVFNFGTDRFSAVLSAVAQLNKDLEYAAFSIDVPHGDGVTEKYGLYLERDPQSALSEERLTSKFKTKLQAIEMDRKVQKAIDGGA